MEKLINILQEAVKSGIYEDEEALLKENQPAIDHLTKRFINLAKKKKTFVRIKLIPQNINKKIIHFQTDIEDTLFINVDLTIDYFRKQGLSVEYDHYAKALNFKWDE